jgi:hypothetical protein
MAVFAARMRMSAGKRAAPDLPAQRAAVQRVAARQAGQVQAQRPTLVRLRTSGCQCQAAQLLGGRLLLASQAPTLPLPTCKRMDCRCRYEQVVDLRRRDRRQAIDRRDAIRLDDGRRHRPDRRMPNTVWNEAY